MDGIRHAPRFAIARSLLKHCVQLGEFLVHIARGDGLYRYFVIDRTSLRAMRPLGPAVLSERKMH